MDNKEIYDVMRFFGRARDECDQRGLKDLAKKCDEAIGLAQQVALLGFSDPPVEAKAFNECEKPI
jgi:hypothetical protein